MVASLRCLLLSLGANAGSQERQVVHGDVRIANVFECLDSIDSPGTRGNPMTCEFLLGDFSHSLTVEDGLRPSPGLTRKD